MRDSMVRKAGLASSFFVEEICSISAFRAWISVSESSGIWNALLHEASLMKSVVAHEMMVKFLRWTDVLSVGKRRGKTR